MSDQLGKYFIKKSVFDNLNPITNEKTFKEFDSIGLDDKNTPTKLIDLKIQITSHRLIIKCTSNPEIMFLINYLNITGISKKVLIFFY